LLVVEPKEYKTGIDTKFGPNKDAVLVDVHDISTGTTTEDVLWFSAWLVGGLKPLVPQFAGQAPQQVLGVMGQRPSSKAGQSDAWEIQDKTMDPMAIQAAERYLASRPARTTPQQQYGQAPAQQYGQVPAQQVAPQQQPWQGQTSPDAGWAQPQQAPAQQQPGWAQSAPVQQAPQQYGQQTMDAALANLAAGGLTGQQQPPF